LQSANGIAIKSWFNDNQNDTELLKLMAPLKQFVTQGIPDVREGLRTFLKKPRY